SSWADAFTQAGPNIGSPEGRSGRSKRRPLLCDVLLQDMNRGAISVETRNTVMPVPVVDEILRNSDPLEDRLRGPLARHGAAYEERAIASVQIRRLIPSSLLSARGFSKVRVAHSN